jgi:hypothetical protein
MFSQETAAQTPQIQIWPIDKLVFYARNPRKNDAAVDRMCASIREFGFKVPVLARSDGTVVDGHLRLKAARKLGSWPGGDTNGIPVILCDEWTPAQVKAFRLMVNRSVTWAAWDDELLALELQELNAADFDLSLTGFDQKEIDDLLLVSDDDELANAAPPLPDSPASRPGDLWLCGDGWSQHRVLCADATGPEAVQSPFAVITAVITSITLKCLKSKPILMLIDNGEAMAMSPAPVSGNVWKCHTSEAQAARSDHCAAVEPDRGRCRPRRQNHAEDALSMVEGSGVRQGLSGSAPGGIRAMHRAVAAGVKRRGFDTVESHGGRHYAGFHQSQGGR